jgi:hypothetical protein
MYFLYIMNLESLSWEELIEYKKKTNFKHRPIIIVDIEDDMNRKYNAIVVKHDDNKNVHIRYLDNPFYEDKYWWTGNKNNLPGLNPLSYHAKFLGDLYDEMEDLKRNDFQEDGYDDIINYNNESHRFFRPSSLYPYLDGIQGNVHVNNYYISVFNQTLSEGKIPNCIKSRTNLGENIEWIHVKKWTANYEDSILYNILESLPQTYSPIVKEYHQNKRSKNIIIDFKKMISIMITNNFIKKYGEQLNLSYDELKSIKETLREGGNNTNLIKILPYILNYHIKIFDCTNDGLDIIEYKCLESCDKYIYMIKFLDKLDSLKTLL